MVQQALADQYKDQVKTWVPKLRKVLQDDLADQLDRLGARRDGKHRPIEKMQLPPGAQETRKRIEALLRHETLGEGSAERGYDNVLFELTYTLLNRLVGLKCMEARQLLFLPPPGSPDAPPEQTEVITLIPGQARSRYLRDFRASAGDRYKYAEDAEEALLRDGLTAAFRHVTNEIRILFDPDHEYACIWPTHPKLVHVISMINSDQPADVYRTVDFLGWVYQFFNRDEKKRVREENKGTPRSSYELAVINQFYTPSWVVKALVDNTLGRLWLQMHPDSSLWPKTPPPLPHERDGQPFAADYLVPRTGEKIRYRRATETGEVEEFKPVRDITLLDPACGTMHFGQYAFSLFYRMYEEEIENAGKPGWPAEPSVTEPREIPAAIIETNLFGIDIDPRAIQIASLSLLLTAKEAALRHGLSPQNVQIRRTNLVVANGVDLGKERLRELVGILGQRLGSSDVQQRLFSTIWDNLQYVGELGSLVRVRESVTRILEDWVEQQAKAKGVTRPLAPRVTNQMQLGSFVDDAEAQRAKQLVLQRRLLNEEAARLRDELLVALEAAAGELAVDPTERLFAEDTARGLKLLQILSRLYDAVVMNPPYGSCVPIVRHRVREAYPSSYNDIYAAFVDRGSQLLCEGGYLGALTSSTFQNSIQRLLHFRTDIVLRRNPLALLLDLGPGVLDEAANETSAYVLRARVFESSPKNAPGAAAFFDLRGHSLQESAFAELLAERRSGKYYIPLSDFNSVTGAPLAYKRIGLVAYICHNHAPLSTVAEIHQGVITRDDPRYVRQFWEVSPNAASRPWVPFHKGGAFSRFYFEPDLVLDWSPEAQAGFWRLRDPRIYMRAGLTWPRAAGVFNVRHMSAGCVYSDKGPAILPHDPNSAHGLCALLNSTLGLFVARSLSSREEMGGRWEKGMVARLPVPDVEHGPNSEHGRMAAKILTVKRQWDTGNETSRAFTSPWLLSTEIFDGSESIPSRLERLVELEHLWEERVKDIYARLDRAVFDAFGIDDDHRGAISELSGETGEERVWPDMAKRSGEQKRMEHVFRLLCYVVKRVIETDEDGIVPFGSVAGRPTLLDRVRRELAVLLLGREDSQIEVEVVNELKRKVPGYKRADSIQEWLQNVFFSYHVSLYNNRPIFWHIASNQSSAPSAFEALVHYHKFDKDRMARLRSTYLREAIDNFRREGALADKEGRTDDRVEWRAKLEEAQELDRRLQWVQEAHHEGSEGSDYRILTPWKKPHERPKGWDPDLDDGVKVNIEPLQKAGVLRIARVV